jgi:hypothetical protein
VINLVFVTTLVKLKLRLLLNSSEGEGNSEGENDEVLSSCEDFETALVKLILPVLVSPQLLVIPLVSDMTNDAEKPLETLNKGVRVKIRD